jgi:mono/diheme cytochrome c family protein
MAGVEIAVMNRKNILLLGLFICFTCGAAGSAEIYQWRDASGVHFVDDPAKVPPEYRKKARRELNALQPTTLAGAAAPIDMAQGELKWEAFCAACHSAGQEKERGKLGLSRFMINDATRFPATQEQVVREFRRAANGSYSDMDDIEISDDELKLIAAYLLRKQKRMQK